MLVCINIERNATRPRSLVLSVAVLTICASKDCMRESAATAGVSSST